MAAGKKSPEGEDMDGKKSPEGEDMESQSQPSGGERKLTNISFSFHIESLRLFGHASFLVVLLVCAIITEKSGLASIPPPEATEIFRIFGFNHVCNYMDHNPARLVAGMMIPLYTVPMILYVFLYHNRLKARFSTHGDIPRWLVTFSQVTLPYNLITFALLHMWFVNNPDGEYGFIAHYMPYLMFQIALSLLLFMNVQYLISTKHLPGIAKSKPWLAWTYQFYSLALTFVSILGVITLLAGYPILDSANNMTEQTIFRVISYLYGFNIVIVPIIFSAIERRNGDENVITYACR